MDHGPPRTWASKPLLGARALGFLLALGACDSGYPLAATTCDDYCRAVQRIDCREDEPADCVRKCELERAHDECDAELDALSDCYANSDSSAFYCGDDEHVRAGRVCLNERRALNGCQAPDSGWCFDECVRQSDVCQSSLDDCAGDHCRRAPAGCEKVYAQFYACLQEYPVECREWMKMETRAPEAVPCYDEALALLACGT